MTHDKRLEGVLFDFDGVIANTEPLHFEAFRRLLDPRGLAFSWDEYVSRYLGFDDRDAFREAFRRGGRPLDDDTLKNLIHDKARAFRALAEERGAPAYPGVIALIKALAGAVPIAIASGALRGDILPILRQAGVEGLFDVMVTAEDVAAGKPDPAAYLLALKKMARAAAPRTVRAERCVAIEDAPGGIEAASKAGLAVLAVANSYPAERLRAAGRVVASLEGIGRADLAALLPP